MRIKQNILYTCLFLTLIACDGSVEPNDEILNPEATTLIFPENNTECNTGVEVNDKLSTVNFQWSAAENTDTYEVIIKELDTNTEVRAEAVTNEVDIIIKKDIAYQWQVVSKSNMNDKTASSEIWKFYNSGDGTINHAPFPADIVQPGIGSSLDSKLTTISLEWTGSDADNDIKGYEVYFETVNPPTNSLSITTDSNIEVNVSSGNTYHWVVKTIDEANNTSESKVFWFKVD